jgi:hypothetical protein
VTKYRFKAEIVTPDLVKAVMAQLPPHAFAAERRDDAPTPNDVERRARDVRLAEHRQKRADTEKPDPDGERRPPRGLPARIA